MKKEAGFLSKLSKSETLEQISKFVVTGFLNTGIDFAVLNLLMWLTGKDEGLYITLFATVSFLAATTNSFFINKHWTFKEANGRKKQAKDSGVKDAGQFAMITFIGWMINAGVTTLLSTFTPFLGITFITKYIPEDILQKVWVNVSKAFATGFSLVWNFLGYKFIVFKK